MMEAVFSFLFYRSEGWGNGIAGIFEGVLLLKGKEWEKG